MLSASDPLAEDAPLLATAGRDGAVRLLNYPCVVESAPCRCVLPVLVSVLAPFILHWP